MFTKIPLLLEQLGQYFEGTLLCLCTAMILLLAGFFLSKILCDQNDPLKIYGYSYFNGPHEWCRLFPMCGGKRQSPVNVDSSTAARTECRPLQWLHSDQLPLGYTLLNDGRKVALIGKWRTPDQVPALTGGPLGTAIYRFVGLHFRWGPSDAWGSEHTLNNKSYPLELQMLFIRQDFASPKAAISSGVEASIAMVSHLFKIIPQDNPYLDIVVLHLGRIRQPGAQYHLPPFPLDWIAPPFSSRFYAYAGSLSEPPCSEVVTWILCFQPLLNISSRQLQSFRNLFSPDGPITFNSRPVQLLHGRKIIYFV